MNESLTCEPEEAKLPLFFVARKFYIATSLIVDYKAERKNFESQRDAKKANTRTRIATSLIVDYRSKVKIPF